MGRGRLFIGENLKFLRFYRAVAEFRRYFWNVIIIVFLTRVINFKKFFNRWNAVCDGLMLEKNLDLCIYSFSGGVSARLLSRVNITTRVFFFF